LVIDREAAAYWMPACAGMTIVCLVAIAPHQRHCERSEAIQTLRWVLDCFGALRLAMTARRVGKSA
jgi:hypothetical protein